MRTLPDQIDGEPQLTCDTLCGNPALIQSSWGGQGNFEVVVPHPTSGLAHYWRDNDDPDQTWHGPNVFGVGSGFFNAVSLIESNFFGGGNLEVVARAGDRLAHVWRDHNFDWHESGFFASGVSGTPSLIQSRFGGTGNFELVVPLGTGGMAHYWRDNDDSLLPWHGPTPFAQDLGPVEDVSLIQSNFGGNLEVVARIGDQLAHFWRDDTLTWHGSGFIASGVSGAPSFVQNRLGAPGNFEVVAPLVTGEMGYFWRDNNDFTWHGPFAFGDTPIRSVSLIQSNLGDHLEFVSRRGCSLIHSWQEAPLLWHSPVTLPQ